MRAPEITIMEALDLYTHYIYVADQGNHRIRRIDLSTGFISTVVGNGTRGCQDGYCNSNWQTGSLDAPFEVQFLPPALFDDKLLRQQYSQV